MLESEAETKQTMTVVPVELPVEWKEIKEFRDTGAVISIQPPKTCKPGKKPVNLRLEPPVRRGDISLLNYISTSLIMERDYLIPFVWNNESVRLLARHYHIYKTSSPKTISSGAFLLNSFSEFMEMGPDGIITSMLDAEGNTIPKAVKKLKRDIEDWQAELKALEYAPNSIKQAVGFIKVWLEVNEIDVGKLPQPQGYIKYPVRAIKTDELQKLIDIADLQGKVIVSTLATSGLRVGTLPRLKYRHVREDLEAGKTPVCISIKAEETKGKYADYFTFINEESAEFLKMYLEQRKRGSADGKIPPEDIDDESPLIRNSRVREVRGVSYPGIYSRVSTLMRKAGLVMLNPRKRNEVNVHSLRKWFKTHMTAEGVQTEYVEFFLGHLINTYNDVKSLGVERLREVYRSAGLSIRPKQEASKMDTLKTLAESLGLDPEKITYEDEYTGPKRTVIGEEADFEALQGAVRDALTELVSEKSKKGK